MLVNEIFVPSKITLEKPLLLQPSMIGIQKVVRILPLDFLDTFDRNKNGEVDEINRKITSDLEDMTLTH